MRHITPFLAALTLALAAHAADAPEKPAADDADINPAVWGFLRAVDAGEAADAYARTTDAYRGDHSLETFTEEVERLRGDVDLKQIRRLQIFASGPPADERPQRAIAVWPTPLRREIDGRRRRVALVLQLSHEDGAWRVASAQLDDGGDYLRDFMNANPGARPVTSAEPGLMGVTGVVTEVKEKSLTLEPVKARRADEPQAPRTFALDAATRVFVPQFARDQKLPDGRSVPVYRAVPGKREDLKEGQKVSVESQPGDDRAVRISILHPDVGRAGRP